MQAPDNVKQRLDAILNRSAANYSVSNHDMEYANAERRLRARGVWPRDRMYLQMSDVPREHAIDVAVEQAHMAVEWAAKATTVELQRIADSRSGGAKWLAAWVELINRGVAQ